MRVGYMTKQRRTLLLNIKNGVSINCCICGLQHRTRKHGRGRQCQTRVNRLPHTEHSRHEAVVGVVWERCLALWLEATVRTKRQVLHVVDPLHFVCVVCCVVGKVLQCATRMSAVTDRGIAKYDDRTAWSRK